MEDQSHCYCLCRESGLLFSTKTLRSVLYTILVLSSIFTTGVSQGAADFISIDCGGTGFVDRDTHIEWSSDEGFLQLRNELVENHIAVPATVNSEDTKDNAEQQRTAMIFIPGALSPSKYCYVVNVQNDTNYLVRAMFPSRHLVLTGANRNVSLAEYSHQFYFIVDSTVIADIELEDTVQTVEVVVYPLDEKMYICVVPLEVELSIAAISSIELRSLPVTLYQTGRTGTDNIASSSSGLSTTFTYLMTVSRLNFGGDTTSPAIRYPIDVYDRLWYAAGANDTTDESQFRPRKTTNSSFFFQDSTNNFAYPQEVLKTAWEGVNRSSNISFTFNIEAARSLRSISTFYLSMFFHDVNPSRRNTSDPRIVDIYLEDDGPVTLWASADTEVTADTTTWWYNTGQEFSSQPREREPIFWIVPNLTSSVLPAMVNAFELLGQFPAETQRTAEIDDSAIRKFTTELVNTTKFVDTAGDPCLPVPWNWTLCSKLQSPPRITQIDLSYNNFSGTIPEDITHLAALEVLDLSWNSLSGNMNVIVELVKLKNLRTLNLQGNSFAGMVPDEIWSSESKVQTVLTSEIMALMVQCDVRISFAVPHGVEIPNLIRFRKNLDDNKFSSLNLTTWYLSVTRAKSFDASDSARKVRLVRNNISFIILPSVEGDIPIPPDDDNRRLSLEHPVAFILLGNCPWCQSLKETDKTLIERYLCRGFEFEDFWSPRNPPNNDHRVTRETLFAVGATCGLLVFIIMSCVLMSFIRRMQRRTRELHEIQEALAKENVKPPFFKYDDIKAATSNFASSNILGSGGFGTVYKAQFSDGNILAVKKLLPTEQNVSDFFQEMVNIMGIKHKHLIQLKGCCVREKLQRMLIYEYAENKNLAQALWGDQKPFILSWRQRFKISLGIARGLAYLHEELNPKMIHRDIKPQNILLDKDFNAKIADFGLIRPAHTDQTQVTLNIGGTRGYCAPEYMNEGIVSEKLDVYSFGVVLLEIASGRVCIDYNLPNDQISLRNWALQLNKEDKLLNLLDKDLTGEYNEEEALLLLQTGLSCCQLDSKKRPTMSQVVNRFMKHEDIVAIEIVEELMLQRANFEDIFMTEGDVIEECSFLSSTLAESQETIVELSNSSMRPG